MDLEISKKEIFERLEDEIAEIVTNSSDKDKVLSDVCEILEREVPYYDWVGFYLVNEGRKGELVLGPFKGEPTEHDLIQFGEGICGQAAEREVIFTVQDVSQENNYLSCSPRVKSEIVVPIFKDGRVVGELDIDSHSLSPFDKDDENFLERVAEKIFGLF